MKKHKFTIAEHFAIWRVFGQKCFYCEQPLAFTEITIDHIIPEHISDDAEQLQTIKIRNYLGPLRFHQKREEGDDQTEWPAKLAREEALVCARSTDSPEC